MKNIKNILGMGAFMLLTSLVIGILTLPIAVLSELMKTESV